MTNIPKIYLALDEIEAGWFRDPDSGYEVVSGSADTMLATVVDWYEKSCWLKFVQGVAHDEEDPNRGYTTIVEQGAEDEYIECDECGATGDTNDFGLCSICDEELSEEDDDD